MLEVKMPFIINDDEECEVVLEFEWDGGPDSLPDLYYVRYPDGRRVHWTDLTDEEGEECVDYIVSKQEKKRGKGCY